MTQRRAMHRRRHLYAALAMLGASAPAAAQRLASLPPAAAASLERKVDSLFARQISATGPGCAVGVYRNGVVLTRGYGLANAEEGRRITPRTTFGL